MRLYRLRVSIIGLKGVHRVIEATENSTFDDLHDVIFDAFDRFDEHLYSFFITKKKIQNFSKIYDSPEITHPFNVEDPFGDEDDKPSGAKTKIGEVGLDAKDVFYYLFDFGDEWWHELRVESVGDSDRKRKGIKVVKSVGESPDQYEDCDDEACDEAVDDEDDETE